MMKRLISILVIIAISPVLLGVNVGAQSLVERIDSVCLKIDDRNSDINARLAEREKDLETASTKLRDKLKMEQEEVSEALSSSRTEAEKKRFESYKIMRQNTDEDSADIGVEAYISSVEKAVSDRQKKFDLAIEKYNQSVKEAYEQNIKTANTALIDFKQSIEEVVTKANDSCTSGLKNADIRQAFVGGLQDARLSYGSDVKPIAEFETEDYLNKRNKVFREAVAEFEAKMQDIDLR